MGQIADAFRHAFRDFVTDGVPASGKNNPTKSEIRPIGQMIEQVIGEGTANVDAKVEAEEQARIAGDEAERQAREAAVEDLSDRMDLVAAGIAASYETRAQLFADLAHEAGAEGRVWGDSNEDYRGVYKKNGASGTGSWTRIGPLPMVTNRASDTIDGLMSADDKADFDDAKDGQSTLSSRLDKDRAEALTSIYAPLTSAIVAERQWGLTPLRSFPAIAGVPVPPWLRHSRSTPAAYVDQDGLVKIAAANEIRHDYDPESGAYLGVLLECEPTTNRLLHTGDFSQAAWIKNQATVTPAAGRAPDGTMTAFKLVESTGSTEHFLQQTVAINTAGWACWSEWFQDVGDNRRVRLRAYSNPTTSTYGAVVFDPATGQFTAPLTAEGATHYYRAKRHKNGWRVFYSINLGTADGSALIRCSLMSPAGSVNYVGDGTSGVLISWPQVEERRFPTSYVKSEGSMGVRARDEIVGDDNLNEMLAINEGMIYFRGYQSYVPGELQTLAQIDDGSNNNSVLLRKTAANVLSYIVTTGGALQASLAGSGSGAVIPENSEFSMVGAWKPNSFAMSANGNSSLTDDAGTVPPLTTLRVGNRQVAGAGFIGHLRHIALFAHRAVNTAVERIALLQIPGPVPAGQVGVFFGDSITEFVDYPARIGAKLGLTAINVGFGGCRMSPTGGSDYDELSMVRLAEAIASGDWSDQITAVANIAVGGDDNTAILARLMAINWATVSYVSIFYGTNDYGGGVPLGAAGDTVDTTWRGAINKVVETLLTAYPHLKIMFATPLWRARLASGDGKDADTNPNSAGIYLVEYVDAEIEQAKRHKLPVIDMYRSSGINAFNHATFLADGLHLTGDGGSQRVADKLAGFIAAEGGAF